MRTWLTNQPDKIKQAEDIVDCGKWVWRSGSVLNCNDLERLRSKTKPSAGLIQSDHKVKAAAVVLPALAVTLSPDQLTLS